MYRLRHPAWLLALVLAAPLHAAEPAQDFQRWLDGVRAEAREQGISEATLAASLDGLEPVSSILEADRNQPKEPRDFCGYMERRLTETRIQRGKRLMAQHRALLDEIRDEYGVPPRYLVSLWGLETNYGDYMGDHHEIAALATLAYDPRRKDLFREQLLAALEVVEQGHQSPDKWTGSWAGATGQLQFMPKTFLRYAVDWDGDGVKDIWNSEADALATGANYMKKSGWRPGETWGRQVSLPGEMPRDARVLGRTRPLDHWREQGVRRSDGGDLPAARIEGHVVLPRRNRDPAFLVYRNYRTFLTWNNSTFFAVSVGTLADDFTGVGSHRFCGLTAAQR